MRRLRFEAVALSAYLIRDAFAGLLRFYLDVFSLSFVWFVPDLLAVVCFGIFIYRNVYINANVVAMAVAAYIPFSFAIGWFFLENAPAALSALKMILPLFVGFCFCQRQMSDYKSIIRLMNFILYAGISGILISSYVTMPWIGHSFESFGVQRVSTRVWWSENELRLSGFAADSTMAAFFVMISFVITSLRRGWVWCVLMGSISLYAVELTTNKTAMMTLSIYLGTLLLLRFIVRRPKINVLRKIACASFLCILIPPALMIVLSGTDLASLDPTLYSLQDRINNSWQNPFIFMVELMPTGFISGCGIGCFNYPQVIFSAKPEYYVPVDNFYIGTLLMMGPIFIVFMILVFQSMQWTHDPYKLSVIYVMNIFTVTVLSYGPASGLIMIAFGFSDVFAPRADAVGWIARVRAAQFRKPVSLKPHAAPFGRRR